MSSEMNDLLKLPDILMVQILGNLDFLSILSVRKVCRSLRHFIDNFAHPNSNLHSIHITESPKDWSTNSMFGIVNSMFRFSNDSEFSVIYEQISSSDASVEWKKNGILQNRIFHNSNHWDIFMQDFRIFWKNQRGKLQKLHLQLFDQNNREFLEKIQKILPENQNFIMEDFEINGPEIAENLNMEKFLELEQWKKGENLKVSGFLVSVPVEELMHFRKCDVHVDTLWYKDVEKIRKKFLHNSHLEYYKITFNNSDAITGLLREFGNSIDFTGRFRAHRRMWFFKIEDPLRVLVIRLYSRHIDFQRMEVSTIPPGAVVVGLQP